MLLTMPIFSSWDIPALDVHRVAWGYNSWNQLSAVFNPEIQKLVSLYIVEGLTHFLHGKSGLF